MWGRRFWRDWRGLRWDDLFLWLGFVDYAGANASVDWRMTTKYLTKEQTPRPRRQAYTPVREMRFNRVTIIDAMYINNSTKVQVFSSRLLTSPYPTQPTHSQII